MIKALRVGSVIFLAVLLVAVGIGFRTAGSVAASRPGDEARPDATPVPYISEVHPSGSGNGTYAVDWFEITNPGTTALDITGWRMDDNSNTFANAVPLRGVTTIPAGRSAIFFEGTAAGTTDAALTQAFSTAWFGSATPPAGTLIGAYGGAGVGLGTGGDAVNIYNSTGTLITTVAFGNATAAATFDNTTRSATVTTLSVAGVNGAALSSNGAETGSPGRRQNSSPLPIIDLSQYVRVGRYDLPEPTRTVPPPGNLLAQEASAVTYNWDTDTLFVTGDHGTAITQVTKTGELIDSMTMPAGSSSQGTEFFDPEGLTYIGGGKFVMTEERDRRAVLFTYVPNTTMPRSATQGVTLGTFVPNVGLEGLTYDPLTNGYIFVKEITPQGIFQSTIDFAAGTASNGSPSTINSNNLFDPALMNLLDMADVFAMSTIPTAAASDASRLLVLSQESGRIVNVSRSGVVSNSLTIRTDPGNPLAVPAQQHEGLTMDWNGNLYVVSENGGGDFDHPQLWVYSRSTTPNTAPTAISFTNQVNPLPENTSTTTRVKVADIVITDDQLGQNNLTLTGVDAAFFEVDNNGLYVKSGTVLDFETRPSYNVTVNVDDTTVGNTPDALAIFTLNIGDVVNEGSATVTISEVSPWSSGNSPYMADWIEITNSGTVAVNIAGWKIDDNSNVFANAVALRGITAIPAGRSAVFIEGSADGTGDAALIAAFSTAWFGTPAPPANVLIGTYGGAGIGLGTGGDAVNLFDAAGNRITGVAFGTSTTGFTFDNRTGVGSTTLPLPTISILSAVNIGGAFLANDGVETGSPGGVGNSLIISEVAPWSSGNSPVQADWFELTNTGTVAIDLTGWKFDDSSGSFAAAVNLNGVSTLLPGESAIFLETDAPATVAATFRTTWFGVNPPAGLKIGSYTGGGVGLSTGGDAVNIYNSLGALQASVTFAASPAGPVFATFDNAQGRNNTSISVLSSVGVNGAFVAAGDPNEIGSPGRIAGGATPTPTPTPSPSPSPTPTPTPTPLIRAIRAQNASGQPGQQIVIPIVLDALGNESSASFSVNFDPAVFSNPTVTLASGVPAGSNLGTNLNQAAQGRIGILVDSTNTYSAGTRSVVNISFTVAGNAATALYPITFGSLPTPQSVSSAQGALLPTTYTTGNAQIGSTAALVSLSGRVLSPSGAGVRGALMTVTDSAGRTHSVRTGSFGYYHFNEIEAGDQIVLSVRSARYRFTPRILTLNDSLADVDFVGSN